MPFFFIFTSVKLYLYQWSLDNVRKFGLVYDFSHIMKSSFPESCDWKIKFYFFKRIWIRPTVVMTVWLWPAAGGDPISQLTASSFSRSSWSARRSTVTQNYPHPNLQASVWTCRLSGQQKHMPRPALRSRGRIAPKLQVRLQNNFLPSAISPTSPATRRHTWTWTTFTGLLRSKQFHNIIRSIKRSCFHPDLSPYKTTARWMCLSVFTTSLPCSPSLPCHSPLTPCFIKSDSICQSLQFWQIPWQLCSLYFNSFAHDFLSL